MSEPEKKDDAGGDAATDQGGRRLRRKAQPDRADKTSRPSTAERVKAFRTRVAGLAWLAAVICALALALGALLVALKANQDNEIVTFFLSTADRLDLGVFSRENGIFTFSGGDASVKAALVNWGIAAVAYLVVGKIIDRLVRP